MSWIDSNESIPVVDFKWLSVSRDVDFNDETVIKTCHEMCQAFENIGFVYLKNTGIPESQIKAAEAAASSFFSLDDELKEPYKRKHGTEVGWGAVQSERLNPNGPLDLKETFDIIPILLEKWPDDAVPNFRNTIEGLFNNCTELAHRVLDAISVGLDLKDKTYLRQNHRIKEGKSHTSLRLLYYPPITDFKEQDVQQMRLGEHSDFGTITLLFQDNVGGLEKHRVLIPKDAKQRAKKRQSMAFFVNADDDCVVRCLYGSDKYEPITVKDYLFQRILQSYY